MNEIHDLWTERYRNEPKGMRSGWINVLGQFPVFPRAIVIPLPGKGRYQKVVNNTQEYLAAIEDAAPRGDLWASWSATTQYDLDGMDWVFGDIDSPDLEDALVRARRYEEWCMADFGVQPAAIFTAGKGFHLHMTHDFVEGVGTAYSDAYASLIQGSGASLDFQPLKHRRTYPRVPYSMNLKATGIHRKPMYVVPVDLTWSLKEILQASSEIRVTPFKLPHSAVLADLLRPAVEKAKKAQERRQKTTSGVPVGLHEDLTQAAIAFCEDVGWRLVNKLGQVDGRRRLISSLYAPALMRETQGNKEVVKAAIESLLEKSGARMNDYKRFIDGAINDCILREGGIRCPMGLPRFWLECGAELKVAPKTTKNSTVITRR